MRVLIRYDIENLSEETYGKALVTIFSEPPVDEVYEEEFPKNPGDLVFSVEYLPGQFDQRADSAEQCVKLLKEDEEPVIRSATTYVITAVLTPEQEKAIKGFCINPVDSREAGEDKPSTWWRSLRSRRTLRTSRALPQRLRRSLRRSTIP